MNVAGPAARATDMQDKIDNELAAKITTLQMAIENWAKAKDLWFDCAFKTYAEHVDGEPTFPAVVSILCFDGPLYSVFNCLHDDGSYDEFCDIVYRLGYEFENSMGIQFISMQLTPTYHRRSVISFTGNGSEN
jgi:hypothetical protein